MDPFLVPFSAWSGPRRPRILLVGEAWGESEAGLRRPFAGNSGKELWRMLGDAEGGHVAPELHAKAISMFNYGLAWVRHRDPWLEATGIAMTNVFNLRPPGENGIGSLCGPRRDVPKDYPHEAIRQGKYILPQYLPHLERLREEIAQTRPNIVVALGPAAAWALLGTAKLSGVRGSIGGAAGSPKVLATYHPAMVLSMWDWRAIAVADLRKAFREAASPEIRRPERYVTVDPTLAEIEDFAGRLLAGPRGPLSVDIETRSGLIRCIGFAPTVREALVIQFEDPTHASGSFWTSRSDEVAAWSWVKALLEAGFQIVGQNFLYDLQYITKMGIRPRHVTDDTMLLHHSLFPEMEKSLGFLGSIYTNEASWKLMNRRRTDEVEKADE